MSTLEIPVVSVVLPGGAAFAWQPGLLWTQIAASVLLAAALVAIAIAGQRHLSVRADIRHSLITGWVAWTLLLAAVQIVSIWTLWYAHYWLETLVIAIAAAVAWWVAQQLWTQPIVPTASAAQSFQRDQHAADEQAHHACTEQTLRRRIATLTEELRRSEENLEQYAYIVSHDLQEPLRMVVGFTQLVSKRYSDRLDDEGREFLDLTVQSASRMSTMLSDLLTLSRIGREPIPGEEVDLNRTLEAALAPLQLQLEAANARLEVEPLPVIRGHGELLRQAFQQLLENAIKFRSERPLRIRVFAEESERGWKLCVQDNGIGLDPKFAARIFQPFQRLHTASEFPGTGIGLALVRRIAERHEGTAGVDSVSGEGATFWLQLPRRRDS